MNSKKNKHSLLSVMVISAINWWFWSQKKKVTFKNQTTVCVLIHHTTQLVNKFLHYPLRCSYLITSGVHKILILSRQIACHSYLADHCTDVGTFRFISLCIAQSNEKANGLWSLAIKWNCSQQLYSNLIVSFQ